MQAFALEARKGRVHITVLETTLPRSRPEAGRHALIFYSSETIWRSCVLEKTGPSTHT